MMLRILIVGLVILVVSSPLLVVIGCGRYGFRAVRWCVVDTILAMVRMVVTVGLLMALILVMLVVLVAGGGGTSNRWYHRWWNTTVLMLRWQQIDVDVDIEIQVITGSSGYSTVSVLLTSIVIRIFAVVIRRVFVTGIDISGRRCVGLVAFVTFTGIGRVFIITCRYTT